MYEKIIIVCGMPRSGTSWLGQIFDSSPDVAFRLEPLFSYQFKNVIDLTSSVEQITNFFKAVYFSDDEFLNQRKSRKQGLYCTFTKKAEPKFLVIKTTRHHNLIECYLESIDCIEIISIVRHPCAVINSWINTDREFKSKGCIENKDWKSGGCRKGNFGEYWGFNDWLSLTQQHIQLSRSHQNFNIVKYAELIQDTETVIKDLFDKLFIPYEKQTMEFIHNCHARHIDDPYSVFKNKSVEHEWKRKLNSRIAKEIIDLTVASDMEEFLV